MTYSIFALASGSRLKLEVGLGQELFELICFYKKEKAP